MILYLLMLRVSLIVGATLMLLPFETVLDTVDVELSRRDALPEL